MSHVAKVAFKPTDKQALIACLAELGLEVRQQQTYKWFGKHVGDYPLPAGFTADQLGKCSWAIGIKGDPNAYEVGVVETAQGMTLLWDFWAKGYGLQDKIGEHGSKLITTYTKHVCQKQAKKLGLPMRQFVRTDGTVTYQIGA